MESSEADTTTSTSPLASMLRRHPAGFVTILAKVLQNLVQRHTQNESPLIQHIRPWVQTIITSAVSDFEKRVVAKEQIIIHEVARAVHDWVDSFGHRMLAPTKTIPSLDMQSFRAELDHLHSKVTTLDAAPTLLPFTLPIVQPLMIFDLFTEENPPLMPEKRSCTDDDPSE